MLIAPYSDFHLECGIPDLPVLDGDKDTVCVFAGDLGSIHQDDMLHDCILPLLMRASAQFKHVIYVLGNHEHDDGVIHQTADKIRRILLDQFIFNVTVLDNDSIVIDGVAFVGSTLWTSCDDPLASFMWNGMPDCMNIGISCDDTVRRLRVRDVVSLWEDGLKFVKEQTVQYKQQGLPVVVVTHHAPSLKSISPVYASSNLNVFFASNTDIDVMDCAPSVWIHGHVHHAFDYLIDPTEQICSTRIVCNPRGYVLYEPRVEKEQFDPYKRISVTHASV